MSTHNLCFEQKYEEHQNFLSENFHVLVVKFSVYLNMHVFVMQGEQILTFYRRSLFRRGLVYGKAGNNKYRLLHSFKFRAVRRELQSMQ